MNAGGKGKFRKVFVLETKGLHLKNENTAYKQSVFALCNKHPKKKSWNELVPAMRDKEISYEVGEWATRRHKRREKFLRPSFRQRTEILDLGPQWRREQPAHRPKMGDGVVKPAAAGE